MSRFCTETINNILPYVPGEQPQDKKYIKLNTNENPYYMSKMALESITERELNNLKLYCDPDAKQLTKEIANFYGVKEENVLVANGSDEILAFSFLAFCKGKSTAFADITYGFYKVYAKLFEVKETIIPLLDDFTLNLQEFVNFQGNIILANPNAQTGLFAENNKLEEILFSHRNNIVLVDEAYADFARSTMVGLTKFYDNLIVTGTFSKSRSLAGARIGFAIANKDIIDDLKKVKYSFNPYNLNSISQILGCKAMADKEYFNLCVEKIISSREWLKAQLKELNFSVLDSKANFILAKSADISGKELYEKLKENGILVRHFNDERICDYVRITIGTDEEMSILCKKIKEILGK